MVKTRSMTNRTRRFLKTIISQTASTEDTDLQSTHDSASFIGSNDDLLTEILLRLPVKYIIRFKSVSKHWRWLLSDRSFTLRFDKLSKSPGIFASLKYIPFDVEDRSTPSFGSLDVYSDRHGIEILQSCNGLLLCCSRNDGNYDRYYVYNPGTKQFAIIPSVAGRRKSILLMCLAFHQTYYAPYKLVCILYLPSGKFQIQIYSSKTQKWKISTEIPYMNRYAFPEFGVYCNRAIHWVQTHYQKHVMRFNIEEERFQTLPFPMSSTVSPTYLGESRGHLHLAFVIYRECNKSYAFNVYEMLADNSGWFVKYRVELDKLSTAFPEMIKYSPGYCLLVVDVVRGEKEEDTFVVLKLPKKLITYNVDNKSYRHIFNLEYQLEVCLDYHRYTETLASI